MRLPAAILLAALLIGCGDQRAERAQAGVATGVAMGAPSAPPEAGFAVADQAQAPMEKQAALSDSAPKLIRNGEIRLEVRDAIAAAAKADSVAKRHNAMVTDNQITQDDLGRHEAHLTLRVPADHFAAILTDLRQLGEVKGERSNTQDVTREYTDLAIRVQVKEQTVVRLRALLTSRTAKLSDVLEVERELSNTISDLEAMKGQQRYYDNQIALSTIQVTLAERAPSRAVRFTQPIVNAFRAAFEVLGTSVGALVFVVIFIVPWLVLVALGWWIVRRVRARRRGAAAVTQPPSTNT
jgi:hypothetical protein